MSVFRNFVLNFKSKEDCENYISKYREFIPTLQGTGLETLFICRLTEDSILTFATHDTEENAKKIRDSGVAWRETNKFEFKDELLLDGNVEEYWNFAK